MLGFLSSIFAADEPPSEELSLAIALGEHGAMRTVEHGNHAATSRLRAANPRAGGWHRMHASTLQAYAPTLQPLRTYAATLRTQARG